jgi:acetate kinase
MNPTAKTGDTNIILALNSGSSSLKFGLYRVGSSNAEMLMSGEAEAIEGAAGATKPQATVQALRRCCH